jgi:D-lactate dehydrogenase
MNVAVFNTNRYDRDFLDTADASADHRITYFDVQLERETVALASTYDVVCIFVNDKADADVLEALSRVGTRLVALRCAGFNNVALQAAARLGLKVVRVVTYSPSLVAEHAVALLLAITRKIHRAYNRTRDSNFSLDGLMGFDLHGKTVAVVGTGKIGRVFTRIMLGFGCEVIGYDKYLSADFEALGACYAQYSSLALPFRCQRFRPVTLRLSHAPTECPLH